MFEMKLPVAKVRANINGSLPQTPKALAVFEHEAAQVRCKHTIVDMGLAHGALHTEKAVGVFKMCCPHILLKDSEVPKTFNFRDLVIYRKNADWRKATSINMPAWAIASVKGLLNACINTCGGLDLE